MNIRDTSTIIADFNSTCIKVENEAKEFNDKLGSPEFNAVFERIFPVIRDQLEHLETLYQDALERESQLAQKKVCCIPLSISEPVFSVMCVYGTAKMVTCAGIGLTFFARENFLISSLGLSLALIGSVFDVGAVTTEFRFHFETKQIADIARLNKEGIKHTEMFKNFLSNLKGINRQQAKLLKAQRANDQHSLVSSGVIDPALSKDLDKRIRECLKNYEQLPQNFQSADVYGRLVLQLVEGLPDNDPLALGLKQLTDVDHLGELPLTIHYLPHSGSRKVNFGERNWSTEELSREDSLDIGGKAFNTRDINPSLELADSYKEQLMDRFDLNNHTIKLTKESRGIKIEIEKQHIEYDEDGIDEFETNKIEQCQPKKVAQKTVHISNPSGDDMV